MSRTRLREKGRKIGDWWKESKRWGKKKRNQTGGTKRCCEIIKDKVRSPVWKGKMAERSPYLYLDRTAERDSASSKHQEKIFRTEGEQGDISAPFILDLSPPSQSQLSSNSEFTGVGWSKGTFHTNIKNTHFPSYLFCCLSVYIYITQQDSRQSSTFEELNCNFSFQKSWCECLLMVPQDNPQTFWWAISIRSFRQWPPWLSCDVG